VASASVPDHRARISVQAALTDREAWLDLARRVERDGFRALLSADHPGTSAAPFVALAAAAAVTERIELAPCVANAGLWDPMALAVEVATLDVVSGGRAVLAVGAGHTPQEWTRIGRGYPSAGARVDRLAEVLAATTALLSGDTVTVDGEHVRLDGAVLEAPRPVRTPVPVLVGGSGPRVLRLGGEHADVVGITGLGRTLPDGHQHEVAWSPGDLDRTLTTIRAAAEDADRPVPSIEALVQVVEITDDADAAVAALAAEVPSVSPADLLEAPYVWIGTVEEIRAKVDRVAALGIDRFVVRAATLDAVTAIFPTA
jgi:probable F420-dependent oxidoreductase